MSVSLRSWTLTIFNLQVWFLMHSIFFYKSFPAEVWKTLFTGTWPQFTLICRFLFWIKKNYIYGGAKSKGSVFRLLLTRMKSLLVHNFHFLCHFHPTLTPHSFLPYTSSLAFWGCIQKRGSMGPYAGADFNLTLSHGWLHFTTQRRRMPTNVSPYKGKGRVRGRGREGVRADFMS